MKPIVLLFSRWNIFSDSNPRQIISGLSQNSSNLLFSTLLNENFQLLHQNKKFDTHISIMENDIEYVPAFYSTIHTKIQTHHNNDSMKDVIDRIELNAENDHKKILILFSNVFNMTNEKVESILHALPSESEKIIIGTDKRDNICFIGASLKKGDIFSEIKFENLTGEYLIKKFTSEDLEILLLSDSDICYDLKDVKAIYNKYKPSLQKFHGTYTHNLINHLTENYRSILQS